MHNDSPTDLEPMIAMIEAKAHALRECLGSLQLARSPEMERAAVNRAIGLLERMKILLRAKRTVLNVSEEWTAAGYRASEELAADARLKHAALVLIEIEIRTLNEAGIEVVHEFGAVPA